MIAKTLILTGIIILSKFFYLRNTTEFWHIVRRIDDFDTAKEYFKGRPFNDELARKICNKLKNGELNDYKSYVSFCKEYSIRYF